MRDALHEFFRPTKEEFQNLWAKALISFDASSLLNLYGYSSETKKELVEAYEKFSDRIILPYQFALEYSRNRAKVISKQISNFQKAQKDLDELLSKHNVRQEQPYLSENSKVAVESIRKELDEGKTKLERSMASDEDTDMLLKLFTGKIGSEPSADDLLAFHAEGKIRYDAELPPGFKDLKEKGEPDCYGDLVAWKQLMAIAIEKKSDVLLVTDDVKEDWWHFEGSRMVGPLPALRKEFRATTGQNVWLYTTDGFLRAAKEFSEVTVGEAALQEVKAALDVQKEERAIRMMKISTEDMQRLRYNFKKFPVDYVVKSKITTPDQEKKKSQAPEESTDQDDEE